jgi:hypothetical protein
LIPAVGLGIGGVSNIGDGGFGFGYGFRLELSSLFATAAQKTGNLAIECALRSIGK